MHASEGPAISPLGEASPPDAAPDEVWTPLEKHGPCFVCQPDNQGGLRADLYRVGNVIRCRYVYPPSLEGPPGHAHGGSTAALLDEVMGAAAWNRRHNMLAAHLEYDFRRPIPLGQEVRVAGWVRADGNRSVRVAAEIRLADGTLAVQATGVFAMAPAMFQQPFFG